MADEKRMVEQVNLLHKARRDSLAGPAFADEKPVLPSVRIVDADGAVAAGELLHLRGFGLRSAEDVYFWTGDPDNGSVVAVTAGARIGDHELRVRVPRDAVDGPLRVMTPLGG